ncbi:MAG TPA: cyclic nucleotide-binding domain-containing protein [Steroidobacteraceae bacterium]|jgi:CRP-like cAMP-binding protein|nr:cyclic nucleotide-binding domain-containing protein [Steroidobacteraceae bacterium]
MTEEREASVQVLKTFAPLDGLKRENIAALAKKVSIRTMSAGRYLFKEGDTDKRKVWLVSGMVELREGERTVGMIRGGTADARNPLSPTLPRSVSARAVDEISYLTIDSELLDVMITWDQTGTYEVEELQTQANGGINGDDWMTTLLQTRSFHRIPPANIQAIFMRMQRVPYRAGDVIIKQGDEGDFFYVIVKGQCVVTRETPLNRDGIKLAELSVGDTFGEEALIAEAKRNATITMQTDGVLMRLAKDDFRELMNEPLLQWANYDQARDIVARGGRWLDVRLPSEHQNMSIEGSLNIPLYFIRLKLSTLDPKTPYVVYCDTGRRSSAAAYILVERGFDAYVLRGGLTTGAVGLHQSR